MANLPPLICRPIPRRPFASSPSDSSDNPNTSSSTSSSNNPPPPTVDPVARFLDLHQSNSASPGRDAHDPGTSLLPSASPASLARDRSQRNLTSSTLFGIFHQADTPTFEPGTPWGPDIPARSQFGADDTDDPDGANPVSAADVAAIRQASLNLLRLQQEDVSKDMSTAAPGAEAAPETGLPTADTPKASRLRVSVSLLGRTVLLFALGMGYGVLVSRLHRETQAVLYDNVLAAAPAASAPASAIDDGAPAVRAPPAIYDLTYDWRYLASWGLAGVVLGTLLPWLDSLLDRSFAPGSSPAKSRSAPKTDWALIVRGIGAFAGVVFAMRKLPWTSSMQASMTLALTNPFLWYLLDRSLSGFFLSATFGLFGSAVLTALNLELMPNPGHSAYGWLAAPANTSSYPQWYRSDSLDSASPPASIVSAATIEMAIWVVSVIFCSCVCFGNIGRWLALAEAS